MKNFQERNRSYKKGKLRNSKMYSNRNKKLANGLSSRGGG